MMLQCYTIRSYGSRWFFDGVFHGQTPWIGRKNLRERDLNTESMGTLVGVVSINAMIHAWFMNVNL